MNNSENQKTYQEMLDNIKVKNVVKDRTKAGKRTELEIKVACLSDIHTGVKETINLTDKIRKGEKISEGELEISSYIFASIERALIDLEEMWGISIHENKELFDMLETDYRKSLEELTKK
jgi:hypothetical protein